ncbi:MAG: hypothetical protein GC201_06890 [Alphaproteobacteria bacterium]|nr:hypothetical protein [Alphaproteobacteria bacterium]
MPFVALLVVVCLAPLPYGAVEIGAWSALCLAVGLCLVAWAASVAMGKAPSVWGFRRLRWPLLLFLLTAAWIIVQITALSPEAWHHPLWTLAGSALGETLRGRISLDPQEGYFGLIRLVAYAAVFWLATQYGRDSRWANLALRTLAWAAGLAAGLGLVIWALRPDGFLWYSPAFIARILQGGRLAFPFVNPDHLAAFAGMGLICAVGMLAGEARGLWRPETPGREKVRRLLENVCVKRWYLVLAAVVLAAVTLLSLSRAGLLVTALGLVALAAALMRRSRPRASVLLSWLTVVLIAAAALFGPSLARLGDRIAAGDLASEKRLTIYAHTAEAIAASPWLGYGYGSFADLYGMYDTDDVNQTVESAHSTVLENVVELGLPAATALDAAILLAVFWCWRGAGQRRRDQHLPAVATGVSVQLLIHSMVDFPLQIPAITIFFMVVLGVGVAQSFSSTEI